MDPLLAIAGDLLGARISRGARTVSGQFHDVVLVPGVAAVRIARTAAEELSRTMELVRRLENLDFPYALPGPLSDVSIVDGRAAVVTAWVDGRALPRGSGDPDELRRVLGALAEVPVASVDDVLNVPHAYAGGQHWEELMLNEAVPRLPTRWQSEARRRIEAARELPVVPRRLVHGDLAGDNMRWDVDGRLVGILDWDLASAWDPAVDAACLSWYGWDAVSDSTDRATFERARIWAETFGIEQIVAALSEGEAATAEAVTRTVAWLERTSRT
jgi:aminoglycoside phosphotransferase (APT) family kinase protein